MRGRPPAARRGAATVEFAVVVPVLLLLVLGIVEIGRLVMVAQVNTNAAREAARYAAQGTADSAAVEAYTRDYLAAAGITGTAAGPGSAVAVAVEAQTGTGQSWQPVSAPAAVPAGTPIRVTVSANFNQQSWLPSRFFVGNNAQVQGVAVMRKE